MEALSIVNETFKVFPAGILKVKSLNVKSLDNSTASKDKTVIELAVYSNYEYESKHLTPLHVRLVRVVLDIFIKVDLNKSSVSNMNYYPPNVTA